MPYSVYAIGICDATLLEMHAKMYFVITNKNAYRISLSDFIVPWSVKHNHTKPL